MILLADAIKMAIKEMKEKRIGQIGLADAIKQIGEK